MISTNASAVSGPSGMGHQACASGHSPLLLDRLIQSRSFSRSSNPEIVRRRSPTRAEMFQLFVRRLATISLCVGLHSGRPAVVISRARCHHAVVPQSSPIGSPSWYQMWESHPSVATQNCCASGDRLRCVLAPTIRWRPDHNPMFSSPHHNQRALRWLPIPHALSSLGRSSR